MPKSLIALFILALPASASPAEYYRCTGPDGRISLQQTPCAGAQHQQAGKLGSTTSGSSGSSAYGGSGGSNSMQRSLRNLEEQNAALERDRLERERAAAYAAAAAKRSSAQGADRTRLMQECQARMVSVDPKRGQTVVQGGDCSVFAR